MKSIYEPICKDYQCPEEIGIGSRIEPFNTQWLTGQVKAFGPHFKEGLRLLDYGCGICRFANFASQFLKDFTYVGLELNNKHGNRCKDMMQKHLGHDPRLTFDFVDNLDKYIDNLNIALFGSVFTHTTIEFTYSLLDILIDKKYIIVFDAIITDKYRYRKNHTDNTLDQYTDYFANKPVVLYTLGEFTTPKNRKHTYFRVEPQ